MPSNATRPTWNSGKAERTKVGKQGVRSLYLFEITEWKFSSDLENLIRFSVIYRFIGLPYEITDICSINPKHRVVAVQFLYCCLSFSYSYSNVPNWVTCFSSSITFENRLATTQLFQWYNCCPGCDPRSKGIYISYTTRSGKSITRRSQIGCTFIWFFPFLFTRVFR